MCIYYSDLHYKSLPGWPKAPVGSAFSSRVLSSTYYQNQSLKKISSSTDIWVSDQTLAISRLSCCSEHELHLINPITFLSTSHTPSCINKTDLLGPTGFCLKMNLTSGHFRHEFLFSPNPSPIIFFVFSTFTRRPLLCHIALHRDTPRFQTTTDHYLCMLYELALYKRGNK